MSRHRVKMCCTRVTIPVCRSAPPKPKLERLSPWAFVALGVGMIAVAAVDYLAASVAVGFVVVGAGLVALGGLAARIDGTVKLGLQGFEFALRARQALDEAEREVEQRDPEEAKLLAEKSRSSTTGSTSTRGSWPSGRSRIRTPARGSWKTGGGTSGSAATRRRPSHETSHDGAQATA
jgi:hypothetical protein